ncbi:hypothetical protein VUR80DRAFT_9016 [Thermomyces stellatus]
MAAPQGCTRRAISSTEASAVGAKRVIPCQYSDPASRPDAFRTCHAANPPPPPTNRPSSGDEIVPCSSGRLSHAHMQPTIILCALSGTSGSPTGPQRADLHPAERANRAFHHSPVEQSETDGSALIIRKSSQPWPCAGHPEGTGLRACGKRNAWAREPGPR